MNIRDELNNLTTPDIYSLMLFTLYKTSDIAEYSSLSQLAFILDKDSLLKLCEFYGGLTIKIPTIQELETVLKGLLLYQTVDIDKQCFDDVVSKFDKTSVQYYKNIKEILQKYTFNSGRGVENPQE